MEDLSRMLDAMENGIRSIMGEMNTSAPGVVVEFDAARNRAVVRPTLPKRVADGTELAAPTIAEVPILWPSMGGAVLTMPVKPGDQVWLQFSQRSLDGWLQDNDAAPDDPRRFDMTDAVAYPAGGRNVAAVDTSGAVLSFGASKIRMTEASIEISVGGISWVMTAGGITQTGGTLTHDGLNVGSTHRHGGVQSGAAQTSGPVA
jgi:hypothetical protein